MMQPKGQASGTLVYKEIVVALPVEFWKRTDYFRRQAVALRLPKIVAAQKKSNEVTSEQQRILQVGGLFKRSVQLQLALIDCLASEGTSRETVEALSTGRKKF